MIPIDPILGWCVFSLAWIICGCLMFAILDIEIIRKGKFRLPEPPPEFPKARVRDAQYNIIMASADHKRMNERVK